jgi:hypothetical protein
VILQPITVLPIAPMHYNNQYLGRYDRWYAQNEPLLIERWELLSKIAADAGEPAAPDDYPGFCMCQHDLETDRAIRAGMREP